ncbi:MAG: DUF5818 domain-containing protein [Longimicrobiaceae bacterium]
MPARSPAAALLVLAAAAYAAACSPPGGGAERDAARPTVVAEPLAGPPGTDVQVRITGFPPDVAVDVGFGPTRTEHRLLSRTATGGDGSSAAAVRVPADAVPGRPYVFVAEYAPALLELASDTFRVTAPAAGPAAPADTTAGGDMDTDTAGEVRVTGRLTDEGVECPALRGDDGRLYTLAGDTGGFKPGDRVTVVGTVAEMSTCMQGTTIGVRTIGKAGNRE